MAAAVRFPRAPSTTVNIWNMAAILSQSSSRINPRSFGLSRGLRAEGWTVQHFAMELHRRAFLKGSGALAATLAWPRLALPAAKLLEGNAPEPVSLPHFPDRLHAFIWRNWTLVPLEKIAAVIGATPEQARALGQTMGLPPPAPVPPADSM